MAVQSVERPVCTHCLQGIDMRGSNYRMEAEWGTSPVRGTRVLVKAEIMHFRCPEVETAVESVA